MTDRWASDLSLVPAVMRPIRDVEFPQSFVRAWALDSLSRFAATSPTLLAFVRNRLRQFERSGSKALAARARRIRERLARKEIRKQPAPRDQ